jgi:hypothetical protein
MEDLAVSERDICVLLESTVQNGLGFESIRTGMENVFLKHLTVNRRNFSPIEILTHTIEVNVTRVFRHSPSFCQK